MASIVLRSVSVLVIIFVLFDSSEIDCYHLTVGKFSPGKTREILRQNVFESSRGIFMQRGTIVRFPKASEISL